MNTNELFITATRENYRYPWHGLISTEDLWSLPPVELNNIYKQLMAQKRKADDDADSLMMQERDSGNETLRNQIEIVRYIFNWKEEAMNNQLKEAERAKKKQHILDLIAKKNDDQLASKTAEELEEMLKEL